jgi:hypothetical protein
MLRVPRPLCTQPTEFSKIISRRLLPTPRFGAAENLSVSGSFVCRCLTSPTMLRLHSPLIKPDVRFSRIRLSDQVLPEACVS